MTVYNPEKDFRFFTENHDSIFATYPNKYVVIREETVILAADTFENALTEAQSRGLNVGEFIIQQCTEGDSAYTQMFHSRAIFI